MENIVLIERYNSSVYFWERLIESNQSKELSVEEVLNKYQGFEGDPIAFFYLNNDVVDLDQIKLKIKDSSKENLLYITSNRHSNSLYLKDKGFFVGYDVGVCEEEKTIYSSIFNEILFGNLEELIVWKNQLNENFLFPDIITAERYLNYHNTLSAEGKGVEDYEEMIIYEIWKL